jgi:predicted HTH domain antitoxin
MISKTNPLRSPSFSLRISKASYLEHIAPISIFSIYSIELELSDRKVCLHTYIRV